MFPRRRCRRGDERGVTLVLVALSMTAVMAFAAIAIDGGDDYPVHRQMQNAADAAAMAGALALEKAQAAGSVGTGTWPADLTDVQSAVAGTVAKYSTASLAAVGCQVVDSTGAVLGACSATSTNWATDASAAGVQVTTTNTRTLFFGSLSGQGSQTITGMATATVQPIAGAPAPYVVCGDGELGGDGYNLLTNTTPRQVDLSAAAAYETKSTPGYQDTAPLVIEENVSQDSTGDCGQGSSGDGKADSDVVADGGYVAGAPGNGSDPNPNFEQPIGLTPCGTDVGSGSLPSSGCDIVLPIADSATGNGSSSLEYHIGGFAVFHIEPGSGNKKVVGWFEGPSNGLPLTAGGLTGSGTCNALSGTTSNSGVCAIKLLS